MASLSNLAPDIQVAQLADRARYHLDHKTRHDLTLADLRALGASREVIRQVADQARAAYLSDPASHWQDGDVARLLDELL